MIEQFYLLMIDILRETTRMNKYLLCGITLFLLHTVSMHAQNKQQNPFGITFSTTKLPYYTFNNPSIIQINNTPK